MAIPEGMVRFIPPGQEEIQNFISSAANQSVRPYSTNEEYLYAMREDLAEWLKELYEVDIHVDNFIEYLQDGILLCQHANRVNEQARDFRDAHRGDPVLKKIVLPSKAVRYTPGRHASTFFARDNVANFIEWCRKELLISEAVMFESNDLILRKNEKNFILCLLEMARRGSKFGVPAPVLIQMEEEIDQEIEQDLREEQESEEEIEVEEIKEPPKQKVPCDFKSLDEMVQYILGMCTCPTQFPMVKVSEGKYKVGGSKTLIFMRILRNHVMVRVGGGWDTLEHYLDKHDPCRCNRHRVEQKIAARTSQVGLSVKQASDIMNKAGTPRNSKTRDNTVKENWSNIKSQSLPGFEGRMSSTLPGRSTKAMTHEPGSRSSRSTNRKSEAVNRSISENFVEERIEPSFTAPQNSERVRSHSPAPSRGSKFNSLPRNSKAPEIKITKSGNEALNQTYPVRTSKSSTSRNTRTTVTSESRPKSPGRSKTPTPDTIRSVSMGSMNRDYRRSVTPTPTVTSQRRAQLSLNRAKSPEPNSTLRNSVDNRKPARNSKGPPSSYRNSETLPRNHRPLERSPRRETTTATPTSSRFSTGAEKRSSSVPRPSSAMGLRIPSETETDSGKRSTLSVAPGHHRSMQDVRQPPRPKSALGNYSSQLSTVPTGRKTVATTSKSSTMQRLTNKTRSQSMDNLTIQKQFASTTETQRNQFFDRLSQPKNAPKSRGRNNLLDENMLVVERKSEGRHSVQRNSQRPVSPLVGRHPSQEHDKLTRESSTSSDTSSQSAHQQPPITPSDLRLRIKRDDDRKTPRGQGSIASTPSPSRDSALASSLRLSVSMTGSPDSPTSRVSYSWTPDSGGDDLESPSSGQPAHTPKIITRHKPESHLKAPPKRKVSNEEVIYVVRNPEGRHQWEHTDTSFEQSQEYIDLSPYKDTLSPRSSYSDRTLRSSIRKTSSSSDSSAISPGARNPNTRVSKAQIQLGKPGRASTPNKLTSSTELRVSQRRNDVGSTSSSSVASSKSSVDSRRRQKITDQVRNMLFTEDGKARPPNESARTPRASSAQRSSVRPRPTTPKQEVSSRMSQARSQARPTTPRMQTRSTTPKPRPKTPEVRRGTLTRQEKLKSFDGPSPKKEPEPVDKETRMLKEFEKELSENKKILAASSSIDSVEDAKSGNESTDNKVEYDYNGRRIRKKPMRSKSPSNLRSKSAPRMDRMPSYDSEATNRSYEHAESMADSEDFEVAMAMGNGAKPNAPTTVRSRSVDDFLDEKGPKPRKDKHESRKSRIPTPVHFNSGRKSVTGVPYHDSNTSKSAMRSNVEGIGSYEIESTNQRQGQRSYDNTRSTREQERQRREMEEKRYQPAQDFRPQKENIRPASTTPSRVTRAEEYDLDNQECFKFGRYGNTKAKPPRTNAETRHKHTDFVDGRVQYFHREEVSPYYEENYYTPRTQSYNSNSNNNNNLIGQPLDQSDEPIPPPRKKGGYHRSNLHSSPADLMNPSANQIQSRQNVSANQKQTSVNQNFLHTRGQPHDRNDSGIEAGTDPDSPNSSSATPIRSEVGVTRTTRTNPPNTNVFSPGVESNQSWDAQPSPNQSAYQVAKSHLTSPQHGVLETPSGKYYYVTPGHHNPRLHTGYDAPKQNQQIYQSSQPSTSYRSQAMNQSRKTPSYQVDKPTGYNQAGKYYGAYKSGSEYSPTSPSMSSSAYSSGAADSRRTSASTIDEPRPRHQAQQPNLHKITENVSPRNPKRRNFNDFFTDNLKLKDSLNKLDRLQSDDAHNTPTNAFQLEDDPFMDERSQGQGSSYENAFTYQNPVSYLSQGGQNPPQPVPQTYYTSSTFPRSHKDPNNNPSSYLGVSDYPADDTPPPPPPRHKSAHKAFEKHKLPPSSVPEYYSHLSQNPDSKPKFQFRNGLDLRQASSERFEEYV